MYERIVRSGWREGLAGTGTTLYADDDAAADFNDSNSYITLVMNNVNGRDGEDIKADMSIDMSINGKSE